MNPTFVTPRPIENTPYPPTYRYLSEVPVVGKRPIVSETDDRPKSIEYLPQTFFGSKTTLTSILVRLLLLLAMLGATGYGGWVLWHKK